MRILDPNTTWSSASAPAALVLVTLLGTAACGPCDPQIEPSSLKNAKVGEPYRIQFKPPPCDEDEARWSVTSGSLPGNLGLSSSGLLEGVPAVAGDYSFTIGVVIDPKDPEHGSASRGFALKIEP